MEDKTNHGARPAQPAVLPVVDPKSWWQRNLKRVGYILSYYVLSITVSVFNAYVIGTSHYNFSFPLFISGTSALVQCAYAIVCLWLLGILKPTVKRITWGQFVWAVLPCAIASSLDVGISNSALKYVSLSFYTMVKSSSPVFVLVCAFALGLERPSAPLLGIMALIGSGVLMTVWSDTRFDVLGFLIVLSAAMLSGIRWSLTQIIIEEADHTGDARKLTSSGPLATILYLAPIAFVSLTALSGLIEGFGEVAASKNFSSWGDAGRSLGIIWIAGTLTFLLILVEYKVVQETSVLTFSVSGIFKEIALITISMALFGDRLLPINYVGIAISISGIALYNYLRYLKKKNNLGVIVTASEYELVPTQTAEPMTGFVLQESDQVDDNGLPLHSRTSSVNTVVISALDVQLTPSNIEKIKKRLMQLIRPFAPKQI